MSNPVFRFARVSGQNIDWMLKRNCSVTPAQLAWMYGALCVVSLAIGGFFWSLGAWFVLGFAGIELLAVGIALLVARCAVVSWWLSWKRLVATSELNSAVTGSGWSPGLETPR